MLSYSLNKSASGVLIAMEDFQIKGLLEIVHLGCNVTWSLQHKDQRFYRQKADLMKKLSGVVGRWRGMQEACFRRLSPCWE